MQAFNAARLCTRGTVVITGCADATGSFAADAATDSTVIKIVCWPGEPRPPQSYPPAANEDQVLTSIQVPCAPSSTSRNETKCPAQPGFAS